MNDQDIADILKDLEKDASLLLDENAIHFDSFAVDNPSDGTADQHYLPPPSTIFVLNSLFEDFDESELGDDEHESHPTNMSTTDLSFFCDEDHHHFLTSTTVTGGSAINDAAAVESVPTDTYSHIGTDYSPITIEPDDHLPYQPIRFVI